MKTVSLKILVLSVFVMIGLSSCSHVEKNSGRMGLFAIPQQEAQWIRNGEPLMFESQEWYPKDMYDVLLDSEMQYLGKYRETAFFINKVDVRPFNRLYTKFGRNKFRVYKKENYDSGKEADQDL